MITSCGSVMLQMIAIKGHIASDELSTNFNAHREYRAVFLLLLLLLLNCTSWSNDVFVLDKFKVNLVFTVAESLITIAV